MLSIKHTLFLVSGVSSFIIFYMGLVNFLTSVEQSTGVILLIFSVFVATSTLLATLHISRSITNPIEKLAQKMTEFSKTNKMSNQNQIKTNVKEIFELNENFESMGGKVEKIIEVQNEYVDMLKDMDRKKVEFSSMVSHELKTPLVPILGYVQMLQKEELLGELNKQQKEAINEIYSSTIKLQRLVGDILTTQKLDLGKLDFKKENIEVTALLNSVIKEFSPITTNKKIQLKLEFKENVTISSDKDRINQVFSNLIKNSIDFVSPGTGIITIGAKNYEDSIEFFVKDNGCGISLKNQKDIFRKFYQIDTSTSRKRNGSGLGLAICKGIIEGLGGKIWVKSIENVETTFHFKIPKEFIPIKLNTNEGKN
ncbi:MAG: HAMP domain-containing histidine kinase [Nitrosopumilus sp.]|uniref:sensor histidine kinase n=1 Tax=Nitrosopumilus sp. TaxID=2024843 RepID=UPI00247CDF84|nr:HAMP domain-containing sensor histidine kinase [Nitrosopumilus sp.]MCV0392271.1 HAMP domain-containing histidine kinase [Nitrosopumilus sp.]